MSAVTTVTLTNQGYLSTPVRAMGDDQCCSRLQAEGSAAIPVCTAHVRSRSVQLSIRGGCAFDLHTFERAVEHIDG
jgi:hypothetical protein